MSEDQANGRKGIWECSISTTLIYKRVRELAINEVVGYDELSGLVGLNLRDSKNQGCIRSARRKALREDSIVTDAVSGVGIKRLDDVGIVGSIGSATKRVYRASKKAVKMASAIKDYNELPNDVKTQHNTSLAVLSAVAVMSQPRSIKRIEQKSEQASERLSLAETLKLFDPKNE